MMQTKILINVQTLKHIQHQPYSPDEYWTLGKLAAMGLFSLLIISGCISF